MRGVERKKGGGDLARKKKNIKILEKNVIAEDFKKSRQQTRQ